MCLYFQFCETGKRIIYDMFSIWKNAYSRCISDMISVMADITDALAEIERLREAIRSLAAQDATLSVQGGNVTVTMDATLTDEERAAVELAIDSMNGVEDISASWSEREMAAISTLRGLLERLG